MELPTRGQPILFRTRESLRPKQLAVDGGGDSAGSAEVGTRDVGRAQEREKGARGRAVVDVVESTVERRGRGRPPLARAMVSGGIGRGERGSARARAGAVVARRSTRQVTPVVPASLPPRNRKPKVVWSPDSNSVKQSGRKPLSALNETVTGKRTAAEKGDGGGRSRGQPAVRKAVVPEE
ncbi:unnamed protein product, partial [Discosporangium mesarthrocarpum]